MTGVTAILWLVFATIGPNGLMLTQQLTADGLPHRFPTETLAAPTPGFWVVYHEIDDWSTAFYVAPGRQVLEGPLAALIDERALPRLLPGLKVPRMFLYAPYHRQADGSPKPLEEMALDVAEYYVNALTEAWLDQRCGSEGEAPDAFCALLWRRAEELWESVPEDQRRATHLGALADFGSHAFSVALELHRSLARARDLGRDPCPAARHPRTLYGMWPKIFTEQAYPGRFQQRSEEAQAGGRAQTGGAWVMTQEVLAPIDKQLLVTYLFEDFWSGDVFQDLRLECP